MLLVLAPLLLLPIVALLGFVGCGHLDPAPDDIYSSRYRDYLMNVKGDPDTGRQKNRGADPDPNHMVGYWRLVEPDVSPNVPPPTAVNENVLDPKTRHDGEYRTIPAGLPDQAPAPPNVDGSEAVNGGFISGEHDLVSDLKNVDQLGIPRVDQDTTAHCRTFNGGYVVVRSKHGEVFYTPTFTIEAWLQPGWNPSKTGYVHTLFSAGGNYQRFIDSQAQLNGFLVEANATTWQVFVYPHTTDVFGGLGPMVIMDRPHHVALVVTQSGPSQWSLQLFVAGFGSPTIALSGYNPPFGAGLYIGVRNTTPADDDSPKVTTPVLAKIQEVALHTRALSAAEIENHATFTTKDPTL